MAGKLTDLSGERVRDELLKILLVPDPGDLAVLMRGLGIFDPILPEAEDVGRLRMIAWLETRAIKIDSVSPDGFRRLAALLNTDAEGARAVAGRLRLSNHQTLRLVTLAQPPVDLSPELDEKAFRRALHHLGPDIVRDLALLTWSGELAATPRLPSERTQGWIELLEACDEWRGAVFPLQGQDALDLGVAEGPAVGELMARAEDWWEEGDYQAGREACLEKLKSLVEETP